MMPFRPIAAAVLLSVATPVLAQAALATDRYAPASLLAYWRSHGAGSTIGDDPSENAPGWFADKTVLKLHQPTSGQRISQAQADLLKRKLDIAFQALMSQPSLKDIRGSSIQAGLNVSVVPTEDGTRLVGASLRLIVKPVHIDDPKTYALGGRYQTPWEEGPSLTVELNPYEFVSDLDPQPEAVSGRTVALLSGAAALIVTDTPHQGEWNSREQAARLKTDTSWYQPGAAGSHPMLVRVSGGRQDNQELRGGKMKPTRPAARLAAAMYMVDWEDVQRRMAAVK
jgi:hypothetical protein